MNKLNFTDQAKSNSKNKLYTFINPFSYKQLREKGVLNSFDGILVDGIILIWILRMFNVKITRKSFDMTSLAKETFIYCQSSKKRIFFVGSTQKAMNSFLKIIKRHYPQLVIVGHSSGFFENKANLNNLISRVISSNTEIVVVGMGAPKQEEFLLKLKKQGYNGTGFTCGGFFHQTQSKINYYPELINKFNLRWLYRILDEPKLLKRYLFAYPTGTFLFIYDLIKHKKK